MKYFSITLLGLILFSISLVLASAQVTIRHQYHDKRQHQKAVADLHTPNLLDREDAFDSVFNLPEVQAWLDLFNGPGSTSNQTGGRPVIKVEGYDDPNFIVHVFELTSTHTATFDWYYVNTEDGSISSLNQDLFQ